ncbi:hypothetical protein GCM10020229_16890 [Kitasatospora albolonga]|uniref:hypothetical protein n=1 Tax=Kitasatospora albolonga TaxID=68173 RepID=UPI0031E65233
MTELNWVPTSCTLPTVEQPLRVAEWDALFADRLTTVSRPDRLRLNLLLAGGEGVEEQVRELAGRESGCCSFFTFTVTLVDGEVQLGVAVDRSHEAVLTALHDRIRTDGGRP